MYLMKATHYNARMIFGDFHIFDSNIYNVWVFFTEQCYHYIHIAESKPFKNETEPSTDRSKYGETQHSGKSSVWFF